jgi:hypothetical protein
MENTIASFIATHPLSYKCERIATRPDKLMQGAGHRHFKCKVSFDKRSMTVYFTQGSAYSVDPSLIDVLGCLQSDMVGLSDSFEGWASDYGYDIDSREAERTYKAIEKQSASLLRVWGKDLFNAFLACEQI